MQNPSSSYSEQPSTLNRRDLHQQVTDTIIKQLEAGTVPWHRPWKGDYDPLLSIPKNFSTGNKYRGINIILLWCSAINQQFQSPEWGSFKQWQSKKEMISKGEKGSLIVYYDTFEKEVDGDIKKIPFLKSSVVFNRCQLQNYVPETPEPPAVENLFDKLTDVEDFIRNTGAVVIHQANGNAFYRPLEDKIYMPQPEQFITTDTCSAKEGYYSTLLHELTHWSGAENRLNRQKGKKFGDENYATEELVAELGAAFLCAELDITAADKPDHAAYIEHWLNVLKNDKHIILTVASEASKAVDYLQTARPEI